MTEYYCSYCEFYEDEFIGTYEQVAEHVLEHPINVDPLPNEWTTEELDERSK